MKKCVQHMSVVYALCMYCIDEVHKLDFKLYADFIRQMWLRILNM